MGPTWGLIYKMACYVHLPISLYATAGTWTRRGPWLRHEQAQWPSLPCLKQGPSGFLSLLVDGGLEPCRVVAKRWYSAWSLWAFSSFACSSWLLKILKVKFKRSCWGVWGPSSAFLSFFWISGDDWEIKWVLLYAQYLRKQHTKWKTRPSGWKSWRART